MVEKKIEKGLVKAIKKVKRVDTALPGGFRDYGPTEAIARGKMIETIRKTFETFGFDPLETSSVQRTEVLTGGEEDSGKIIFNVKGSQEKESDTSLRFDLTVPLARFIAANPDIPKPFKRYQIGNVWRGERPQAGRYREFMQADVDIVGSSSIDADAEIIAVIYQTLQKLGLENFTIKINSRKNLNKLPQEANFPVEKLVEVLRIIDKEDKIGKESVRQQLVATVGIKASARIFVFLDTSLKDNETEAMKSTLVASGVNINNIEFSPRTVRGLQYYTGTVFETVLNDIPEIGSVFSGGRYDDLVAKFTGQNVPAVGASIGVDRLFTAMEKLGTRRKLQTLTQVLVLNLSSELTRECLEMVKNLRDAEINTSFYLGDDTSFQAQLSYAVKKEIPFVVIYGEEEKKKGVIAVKNLSTREQKEVRREELVDFLKKEI